MDVGNALVLVPGMKEGVIDQLKKGHGKAWPRYQRRCPPGLSLDFVTVTHKGHKFLVADRIHTLILEKVFAVWLLHAFMIATGFLSN